MRHSSRHDGLFAVASAISTRSRASGRSARPPIISTSRRPPSINRSSSWKINWGERLFDRHARRLAPDASGRTARLQHPPLADGLWRDPHADWRARGVRHRPRHARNRRGGGLGSRRRNHQILHAHECRCRADDRSRAIRRSRAPRAQRRRRSRPVVRSARRMQACASRRAPISASAPCWRAIIPWRGANPCRFRECLRHPLIVPDASLMLRTRVDALASACAADFAPQFTCNSIAMMKSLARLGVGLALLTELDVMTETDAGDLVYIALDDPLRPRRSASSSLPIGISPPPPRSSPPFSRNN